MKSVMSAIPNYVMQGEALCIHLCKKLDKINRDFLWGSTREKKKLHLVGWSKIIKPKEEGGLRIQAAREKNLALLAKLNWRMYKKKEALWANVILKKYCSIDRRRSRNLDKLPASSNWKAIKAGFQTFADGICLGVGNGTRIRVWTNCWIRGKSLRELIEGMMVVELLGGQGQRWRWERLSFELPQEVKDRIKAIPLSQVGRSEDLVLWKHSKDGEFSAKSAYLANIS